MKKPNLNSGNTLLHLAFCCIVAFMLFQTVHIQGGFRAFPDFIHGWTQSDRYAIAVNYGQSQPNFFFPAGLNNNPGLRNAGTDNRGISAMDLPLTEYLVGGMMRLSQNFDPFWFRFIQMLLAAIGLYALWRILIDRGLGVYSFIPVFMLLGSPTWLYYAVGFIPSISAISMALIGCYFFFARSNLKLGLLLSVLAGLIRMPLLMVSFAMLLSLLPERVLRRNLPVLAALAGLVYLPWFLWSQYLKEHFGSMFLTRLMPAKSLEEIQDLMGKIVQNWGNHFFSQPVWVLLALFFISVPFLRKFLVKSRMFRAGVIGILGGFLYFLIMARQFENHDYYLLDAFLVPVVLIVIAVCESVPMQKLSPGKGVFLKALLPVFFLFEMSAVKATLLSRVAEVPWDRYHLSVGNFKGSDELLYQLGIPSTEAVLVIDAYSTNAPLLLMKRRGYTILGTAEKDLKKSLSIPVKHALIQDAFLRSDVISGWPEIIRHWERIGGNGRISVFRKTNSQQSEEVFTGVESSRIIYDGLSMPGNWEHVSQNPEEQVLVSDEYGPTFRKRLPPHTQVLVWADIVVESEGEFPGIEMIFSLEQGARRFTYQYSLNDYTEKLSSYPFKCMVPLETQSEPGELVFYVHNPKKRKSFVKIHRFNILDNLERSRISSVPEMVLKEAEIF